MSVNLLLTIEVRGHDRAREKEIRAAIAGLLEKEGLEQDFGKLAAKDGALRASTPAPVIISASYEWLPVVQKALAAAVKKANGKTCEAKFTAADGDEEEEIPTTPGPLLAPKVKGFDRYEDVVARTPNHLVFASGGSTLVTKIDVWPPKSRVLHKLEAQGADEGPDGSLALLSKGRLFLLAGLESKPRALPGPTVAGVAFMRGRLLVVEAKSWKAKWVDRASGKRSPVQGGAPSRELTSFVRGGDFLIWNGATYVEKNGKLVKVMSGVQHTGCAEQTNDGELYYLGRSGQLVTQKLGGKLVVVPYDDEAHWSKEVAIGPQGSLLLRLCENYQRAVASFFFPAEKKFFYVGQKHFAVGDDSEALCWSPRTGRVICVGRGKMIGVPVEKLMRFKKRPVNVKAWNDHVKRYAALYED